MNIYRSGKSRYITSAINGKDYNLTTGHFKRHLDALDVSLADYFEQHEKISRDKCQACDKPAAFFGYHPDDSVKWHSVCGDPECTRIMYSRAHLSRTPENWAAASEKRRKTFADNPEILAARTKIIHEANLRVGEDGLTGYERTAAGRKKTLLEKHGREDYANWDQTKQTWADKPEEELQEHGEKVSAGWHAKPEEDKKLAVDNREKTKLEKYGKPGWKIAYDASSSRYSNIADEFCEKIAKLIPDQEFIYGKNEFNIDKKYYDFTIHTLKKIIEFNGNFWHADPKKHKPEDIMPISKKTAQQIWDADAAKIKLAEDAGYQVKVVWESDYRRNPQKIIEECTAWLKS